jgi:hypothetical protein
MAKTRADLASDALSNLGIVILADGAPTRTRADWVNETLYLLGVIRQTDTSAVRTRSELVNNVAFILGPGEVGQALNADDYAAIDMRFDTVIGDLNARAIATIGNANAIPGAWFDALSAIVANVCKEKYGVTGDEATKLQAEAALAEGKLKTLTRTGLVDEVLPSIVGDLNARSIATVADLGAIPGAWLPSLADIAAEFVKGRFGVSPERSLELTARAQAAERKLKAMTRAYLVDRNIDAILADLAARDIVYLVDQSDIPDEWYFHLAAIVADRCKGKFELDPLTLQRVSTDGAQALMDLRELTRGRPSYLPQQTSYF